MAVTLLSNSALCFHTSNRTHVSLSRVSVSGFPKTKVLGIGFLSSQLGGIKISPDLSFINPPIKSVSPYRTIQPIARRICPFTGKKANKANKVSFSNHKTKKLQFVNLQYKRVWWEAGKRFLKLRLSTKALKTIEKNGLDAVAKKAGIDLRKK
ncbi:ribosomal L28 family [Tasmannia lanceolata]|uniref:ribosomal L28 family n=1 Tax=Tasmannia lanceolata TaxID=3420 RepID=UPI00406423AE